MCSGLGYIHTWFSLFLFHIIRPCVSVHFLSPLFQFLFPTHIALYPFSSIYCFGLSSLFLLRLFPVVIPVRSSYYDGLCHIDLGISSFLCRFHIHTFIVGISDVAKLIFLLYIHFLVVVFHLHLLRFTYIVADCIHICGEIYGLAMLF